MSSIERNPTHRTKNQQYNNWMTTNTYYFQDEPVLITDPSPPPHPPPAPHPLFFQIYIYELCVNLSYNMTIMIGWNMTLYIWTMLNLCHQLQQGSTPEILDLCDQRRDLKKRGASQKLPKTIKRLKERSGQRWRWQKRLGYRINTRK